MDKTNTNHQTALLDVYTYEGKLLERSALEPYLFNSMLTKIAKKLGISTQQMMSVEQIKKRIEQAVTEKVGELEFSRMTSIEYMAARQKLLNEKYRQAQAEDKKLASRDVVAELVDTEHLSSTTRKNGASPYKKSSFTYPDENMAISGLEPGRDYTQLYGRLGIDDTEVPGIKIMSYLRSPERAPLEELTTINEYRELGVVELNHEINKLLPKKYDKEARHRLYLASLILSEKGIAPRWRGYRRVFIKDAEKKLDDHPELVYSRDVQLFDLEWLRRQYPKHKPAKRMNGLYLALADSDEFDFTHAFMVASSKFTSAEKARQLKLSVTMQMDNFIVRSKQVDRRVKALEIDADEVYTDLLEAAQRNRRRGTKLEKVIPDRVNIWLSAMLTHGNSISAMCDVYKKITGNLISPSSFRKKFRATQKALLEVDSEHFIRELVSL